ncbi:MAG: DUF1460 domain-containing protein [Prevotellaceae bacterium]|jgi:hypothetical protein|nr:DUF1460 domain-containing protein [Prevotellaceae bacterium]
MKVCVRVVIFTVLSLNFAFAKAQSSADKEIFDSCVKSFISQNKTCSIIDIAMKFIDKPYRSNTLEINTAEQLVVNLREFDCTTFVETVIAIFLTLVPEKTQEKEPAFEKFKQNLAKIRYRDGIIDGYLSRLHYASDWISDNQRRKTVKNISQTVGGEKSKKISFKTDYMSTHPENYPFLKANPGSVVKIKNIEQNINTKSFYYIPKSEIQSVENKIRQGNIIFFVTSKAGLDISHLGIACRKNGRLTFIHATQTSGKVVVNSKSLVDYCMDIKSNKGIIICEIYG